MRIPLIDRAGNSIDSPADEDAEFGVLEPLGNLVVAQGFPVGPVRSVVGLAVGQLQQSIAAAIEFETAHLPFLVDLFRRFDPVRWRPGICNSACRLRYRSGGITRLGRPVKRRRTDPNQQQKKEENLHVSVPGVRQSIARRTHCRCLCLHPGNGLVSRQVKPMIPSGF